MRVRSLRVLLITICLTTSLTTARGQQTANNPANHPETAQGKLAWAFIDAINTGKKATQEKFVVSNVSERALKGTPVKEWVSLMQKLFKQSNGLVVDSVSAEEDGVLNMIVRARGGNHWARLVLISSRAQPEKLLDIFVLQALDPAIARRSQLPKEKRPEAEVIKSIRQLADLYASVDYFSGVVLVAKGECVMFHQAYGMAEQSFKVPNNLTTKFHLGSMDKMFTGVAIAQLVAAGKLSFTDTLAKVLPDFPNKEMAEKVTIHQLLTHTAGTGDFIFNPEFRAHREKFRNLADYLPLVATDQLRFAPGTRWSYSNNGFVLLGMVIEKISGESYFDYVHNHIFKVAGMGDTGYYELNEVVSNVARGYLRDRNEDPFGVEPRRSNVMFIPFKGNSTGGGYSTVLDLMRFAQALRRNKLLSRELTETVTTGKVDMVGAPQPAKYGYGFSSSTINGKEIRGMGGGGAGSGVSSSMTMFWDGSYTVIVLSNYDPPAGEELKDKICEFLSYQ